MAEIINSFAFWATLSCILYLISQIFILRVENEYLAHFEYPTKNWRDVWRSISIGAIALLGISSMAQARLPFYTIPCMAIAASSLVGTWRVDRRLLLIPERYQLLGLLGGLMYTGVLIGTGEDWQSVVMEACFGLLLVGLLWLLSYVYFRLRGTIGFGFGDVKLLAWLSFFIGKRMADIVLLSIAIGMTELLIASITRSIKSRKLELPSGKDVFAFGPSIVLAVVLESLYHYG
jgi:prepilin signal peptidase PulO-like enzyme (type II secretory pathway)